MSISIISNPILDKLPKHLFQYVHPQTYEQYSSVDQAVWRYVMRRNIDYLSKVAHGSYLEGLKKTGISLEHIPSMYGMNRILQDIGWAAVAVDGFIPPAAFMEFQAYNVLVIASDIRQLEHIQYTPAPDIIHESAGHAPIIANPEYAEYLRRFGEIGCKAISSEKDYELYEAVRRLSILKETEGSTIEDIEQAEQQVLHLQANMGEPSEMAQIRNLHWWTVEYGLIGTIEHPKIYGAGLLSSIGESTWCMSEAVKKIPYDLSAIQQFFDITKPQPQLYVTPDFAHLSLVLEEFANTMALRKGGLTGVQKLITSKQLGTIELSTGLQISGTFTKLLTNENEKISFIQLTGPTALAYRNKELIGHGTSIHPEGFGSPIGKLKGINLAIEDMYPRDLEAYDIYEGKSISLEFEGSIHLQGEVVTGTRNLQGKIILITFKNCTVRHREEILFHPDWGIYHLAVGKKVVSAFAGPADNASFNLVQHELPTVEKNKEKTVLQKLREDLYTEVRMVREGTTKMDRLPELLKIIEHQLPMEWLLLLNIRELLSDKSALFLQVKKLLTRIKTKETSLVDLIDAGQALPSL